MSKTKDINTTMAQSHNDEIGDVNESSYSNSINNSITNGDSTLNSDNNVFSITNNFENYARFSFGPPMEELALGIKILKEVLEEAK